MRLSETQFTRLQKRLAKPAKPARLPAPTEQQEQEAVMAWARMTESQYPELALLHHVPNGGERTKAAGEMMRRAGTKPGVPDLVLPCQRAASDGRRYGALYVEMKRADHSNGPSLAQQWWIERLREQGYMVVVAYGAVEAIEAIEHYLMLARG